MNPIRRTVILGAAAVAFAAAPLAGASAGDYYDYHRHWHPEHHDDAGVAVAAGILGLAAGAVIGGALTPQPAPVYMAPPPREYVPVPEQDYYTPDYYPPAPAARTTVITIRDRGELEPWSPEWNRYCANRYPSFDPRTGTFVGYDGHDHFCVAP
jgi:hypothetical protein